MTNLDRNEQHAGYWPSPWPVECGGNRRQKAAQGGLHAATRQATVTTRVNGRWNVMTVRRNPGEWFVALSPAYETSTTRIPMDVLLICPPLSCLGAPHRPARGPNAYCV